MAYKEEEMDNPGSPVNRPAVGTSMKRLVLPA
jgi:hypothetical protein